LRLAEAGAREAPPLRPGFYSVNIGLLGCGSPLGFGLYCDTLKAGRVLVLEPDQKFTPNIRDRLSRSGVSVFILDQDRDAYLRHLESRFSAMITDPATDTQTVASLGYEVSRTLMEHVLDQPDANKIQRGESLVRQVVDLILGRDEAWAALIRLARHDYYTYTHSCNVGLFGLGLLKELIQDGQNLDIHSYGTALFYHDIGKSEIGLDILNKPGPLDSREEEEMKKHPEQGFLMVTRFEVLTPQARLVVSQHHECCDGSGYPRGLLEEEIHRVARVCAIADVFDALTSDRPYRPRISAFKALKAMQQEMAGHFDRPMLDRFTRLMAKTFADQASG